MCIFSMSKGVEFLCNERSSNTNYTSIYVFLSTYLKSAAISGGYMGKKLGEEGRNLPC